MGQERPIALSSGLERLNELIAWRGVPERGLSDHTLNALRECRLNLIQLDMIWTATVAEAERAVARAREQVENSAIPLFGAREPKEALALEKEIIGQLQKAADQQAKSWKKLTERLRSMHDSKPHAAQGELPFIQANPWPGLNGTEPFALIPRGHQPGTKKAADAQITND